MGVGVGYIGVGLMWRMGRDAPRASGGLAHAVSSTHAMVCVVVLHTVRHAWDTVATVTVTDAEGDAEGAWPQD